MIMHVEKGGGGGAGGPRFVHIAQERGEWEGFKPEMGITKNKVPLGYRCVIGRFLNPYTRLWISFPKS
jgi:hypothetical protein